MTEGTDLARIPEQQGSAALEAFRAAGQAVAEAEKIKADIQRQIAGTQWGTAFSLRKQNAIAQLCHETGASPVTDIDILGDRPYLNAHYWQEFVAGQDEHIKSEQYRITPDHPDWNDLGPGDVTLPAGCQVFVTAITRYMPLAFKAYRRGELTFQELHTPEYMVTVKEANWAPKSEGSDPVGKSHPALTARTRSFRRTARRAFSARTNKALDVIAKAEAFLEAEWEVVDEVAAGDGEMVVGAGEPAAIAETSSAGPPPPDAPEPELEPEAEPEPEPEPEDPELREDRRKAYFATLGAFGLKPKKKRKAFHAEHGLPESSTDFRIADFERAIDVLMIPLRERVRKMAEDAGTDLEQLSLVLFQKSEPEYASEWMKLEATLVPVEEPEPEENGESDEAPAADAQGGFAL